MQTSHKYLDPVALSRIGGMELVARLVVEGFVTGLHKSPYQGFSVEFAEHRQYMPGDEIRYIDWKVYGKSDRYYVKKYEEETNLRAYILLDTSASMNYKHSEESLTKFEYGCYLAATLTYLMLKQRDSVGLALFDTDITKYIPPTGCSDASSSDYVRVGERDSWPGDQVEQSISRTRQADCETRFSHRDLRSAR